MKLSRKKSPSITDIPRRRRDLSTSSNGADSPQQFRRGRTITGSSSSSIASGNELRADILSPRAQSHHLNAHRKKIIWRLVGMVIACLLLYVFIGQLVASVTVRSSQAIDVTQRSAYIQTLDRYFAGHPTERFKPALDTVSMTKFLQASHPEIQSAMIRLTSNFGKAQLAVTLREPIARWTINGSEEFVDASGTVFKYNAVDGDMIQIVDNNGITSPNSGVVASKRFLSFVGLIVGDMKDRGYQVTKATIPPLTTRQLSIRLKGVPYSFTLSTDRSAGEQTEDAARIIAYLTKEKIRPSYVDIRVKGKAFYK